MPGSVSANLREAIVAAQAGKASSHAAAQVSVSPRSVEHASKVLAHGAPALVAAVDRGEVAVSTAAAERHRQASAKGGSAGPVHAALRPCARAPELSRRPYDDPRQTAAMRAGARASGKFAGGSTFARPRARRERPPLWQICHSGRPRPRARRERPDGCFGQICPKHALPCAQGAPPGSVMANLPQPIGVPPLARREAPPGAPASTDSVLAPRVSRARPTP